MQTFIMRIHPVCPEPASKPSFTRQRAGPRTYVQFHSRRVQMRYGNDVDRVEVFSRSGGEAGSEGLPPGAADLMGTPRVGLGCRVQISYFEAVQVRPGVSAFWWRSWLAVPGTRLAAGLGA